MGKERKKESLLSVLIRGSFAALLVYLSGAFLAAFLLVKGVLPESAVYPMLAVDGALATLSGCLMVRGRTQLGKLPAALMVAGAFCCLLLLIGLCFWQGIYWTGEGGGLLLCAVGGGVLSALLSSRKRKKGKRLRK